MRFTYGKQDLCDKTRAQSVCYLSTNGLGGYSSMTAAYSIQRADQGLLVSAEQVPNERINLVHRMKEVLQVGEKEYDLSTQFFADDTKPEEGYRNLSSFTYEYMPCWMYEVAGVRVRRILTTGWEQNVVGLIYLIDNRSGQPCTIMMRPSFKFAPKEAALEEPIPLNPQLNKKIRSEKYNLYMQAGSDLEMKLNPIQWEKLAYPQDGKDGRPKEGLAAYCYEFSKTIKDKGFARIEMAFSSGRAKTKISCQEMMQAQEQRMKGLEKQANFKDPIANQLVLAADAFITRRDSTKEKTIIAGYPLFADWGRDTMIALTGCCLSTGRYEDAKSILRTFLAYEKDGLMPNLFPEGKAEPMYNTVDASLLFFDCMWHYMHRTNDVEFLKEAFPVMERIIEAYKKGTHHGIYMDKDGLICAGEGMDQVTWMDVCVDGILPTPRHGKPVEINAYWYNALQCMNFFEEKVGRKFGSYVPMCRLVKKSFMEKFYMKEKGYLRDVISGTSADEQIRCNQIWALSLPFSMLSINQMKEVLDTVYQHLYTSCGLRTLSPKDPEYHGFYGGPQVERDMAYHQGTVWPFPMGAYYRAYLRVYGFTDTVRRKVREDLELLQPMLREGCVGQLPEVYDGDFPTESKGCYAQAWSVGEILRVLEEIERGVPDYAIR